MTDALDPDRTDTDDLDHGRDEAEALIDEEAATIDPRDPDAAEQIEGLIDDADELGLPTPAPAEVDPT
jgi:hypothetical protein